LIQNSGVHPAGGGQFGHPVAQPLKLSDIPVLQALVFLCGEQRRDIVLVAVDYNRLSVRDIFRDFRILSLRTASNCRIHTAQESWSK
jgi:hypothetical protein